MNASEFGISETEIGAAYYDAAYETFSATHNAPDDSHSSCDIYNPFGMCGTCDEAYRMGMDAGARDFAKGVALVDGLNFWRNSHPEIPRTSAGALDGYSYGWGLMSLRSGFSLHFPTADSQA